MSTSGNKATCYWLFSNFQLTHLETLSSERGSARDLTFEIWNTVGMNSEKRYSFGKITVDAPPVLLPPNPPKSIPLDTPTTNPSFVPGTMASTGTPATAAVPAAAAALDPADSATAFLERVRANMILENVMTIEEHDTTSPDFMMRWREKKMDVSFIKQYNEELATLRGNATRMGNAMPCSYTVNVGLEFGSGGTVHDKEMIKVSFDLTYLRPGPVKLLRQLSFAVIKMHQKYSATFPKTWTAFAVSVRPLMDALYHAQHAAFEATPSDCSKLAEIEGKLCDTVAVEALLTERCDSFFNALSAETAAIVRHRCLTFQQVIHCFQKLFVTVTSPTADEKKKTADALAPLVDEANTEMTEHSVSLVLGKEEPKLRSEDLDPETAVAYNFLQGVYDGAIDATSAVVTATGVATTLAAVATAACPPVAMVVAPIVVAIVKSIHRVYGAFHKIDPLCNRILIEISSLLQLLRQEDIRRFLKDLKNRCVLKLFDVVAAIEDCISIVDNCKEKSTVKRVVLCTQMVPGLESAYDDLKVQFQMLSGYCALAAAGAQDTQRQAMSVAFAGFEKLSSRCIRVIKTAVKSVDEARRETNRTLKEMIQHSSRFVSHLDRHMDKIEASLKDDYGEHTQQTKDSLKALRVVIDRLISHLRPDTPSLADIFVTIAEEILEDEHDRLDSQLTIPLRAQRTMFSKKGPVATEEPVADLLTTVGETGGGFAPAETCSKSPGVVWLRGSSGTGKSCFLRALRRKLLQEWLLADVKLRPSHPFPFLIPLGGLENLSNLVEGSFGKYERLGLKSAVVNARQKNESEYSMAFLLDGFDEVSDATLFTPQSKLADWEDCKIIVSSRPEKHSQWDTETFGQMICRWDLLPFTTDQIEAFLERWVESEKARGSKSVYDVKERAWYTQQLDTVPNLRELCSNPYLLTMVARVLPRIVKDHQRHHKGRRITRRAIYKEFIADWHEMQINKILLQQGRLKLYASKVHARSELLNHLDHYSAVLSHAARCMDTRQYRIEDKMVEDYLKEGEKKQGVSKQFLDVSSCIKECWLLKEENAFDPWVFPHSSLMDYFCSVVDLDDATALRKSSFSTVLLRPEDENLIMFLVDFARGEKKIEDLATKKEYTTFVSSTPHLRANCMTVLSIAKRIFCGVDFSGFNLSGAILQGAEFYYCNFNATNLTGCDLNCAQFINCSSDRRTAVNESTSTTRHRDSSLRQYRCIHGGFASRAYMGFFELRTVVDDKVIFRSHHELCKFSPNPNGLKVAILTDEFLNIVDVNDTDTDPFVLVLTKELRAVSSMFWPNLVDGGDHIVLIGRKKHVVIQLTKTPVVVKYFDGIDFIQDWESGSMGLSPNSPWLVGFTDDEHLNKTLMLLNYTDFRKCQVTDAPRKSDILALHHAADPTLLFIVKVDGLQLWSLPTGGDDQPKLQDYKMKGFLEASNNHTINLAVGKKGHGSVVAVSCGYDVVVFDAMPSEEGSTRLSEPRVLKGHEGTVHTLAVSDNSMVASVSDDNTLRLWDASSEPQVELSRFSIGSNSSLESLQFLERCGSSQPRLVSIYCGAVRQWNLSDSASFLTKQPPSHLSRCGAASLLKGDRIVSAGLDGTVRIWEYSPHVSTGNQLPLTTFRHKLENTIDLHCPISIRIRPISQRRAPCTLFYHLSDDRHAMVHLFTCQNDTVKEDTQCLLAPLGKSCVNQSGVVMVDLDGLEVRQAFLNSAGDRLLVVLNDNVINMWDAGAAASSNPCWTKVWESALLRKTPEGRRTSIDQIAFTPNDKFILIKGIVITPRHPPPVNCTSLFRDDITQSICLLNGGTGALVWQKEGFPVDTAFALVSLPASNWIAVSHDGATQLLRVLDSTESPTVPLPYNCRYSKRNGLSSFGRHLVVMARHEITCWALEEKEGNDGIAVFSLLVVGGRPAVVSCPEEPNAIEWIDKGQRFMTTDDTGGIRVWEPDDSNEDGLRIVLKWMQAPFPSKFFEYSSPWLQARPLIASVEQRALAILEAETCARMVSVVLKVKINKGENWKFSKLAWDDLFSGCLRRPVECVVDASNGGLTSISFDIKGNESAHSILNMVRIFSPFGTDFMELSSLDCPPDARRPSLGDIKLDPIYVPLNPDVILAVSHFVQDTNVHVVLRNRVEGDIEIEQLQVETPLSPTPLEKLESARRVLKDRHRVSLLNMLRSLATIFGLTIESEGLTVVVVTTLIRNVRCEVLGFLPSCPEAPSELHRLCLQFLCELCVSWGEICSERAGRVVY